MSAEKDGKSSREPGRPQKRLNPDDGPVPAFAQALRDLREASGSPAYSSLARYAGVPHQRLAEAARGERLAAWAVVEGYVRGCREYCEHRHHRLPPLDGAGDLARWRQLYRDAGGAPPAVEPCGDAAEEVPAVRVPAGTGPSLTEAPSFRGIRQSRARLKRPLMLAAAAVVGAALLTGAGVMAGMSLSGKASPAASTLPKPGTPTARTAGMLATPPEPACGNVAEDRLRSPAATAFDSVATVYALALDGFSLSVEEGTYDGKGYLWAAAPLTGRRAGMQLR